MAHFVVALHSIKINGTDLTDHMRSVSLELTKEDLDATVMGNAGRAHTAGLESNTFSCEAYSDFAASEIHATLLPIFQAGTPVLVEGWPAGTVTSSTNPKFSGQCSLLTYTPLSGEIGAIAMTPLEMPMNGTVTVTTT